MCKSKCLTTMCVIFVTTHKQIPILSLMPRFANAKAALADAQAALRRGDFTAYGKAQDRLEAAIAAAISAQK